MRISDYIGKFSSKKIIVSVALATAVVVIFIVNKDNSIITRAKLKEYRSLDKKIQELNDESSKYYSDNSDEISKYLDLRVEYEEVEQSFYKYKEEYPDDLAKDIETATDEVNEHYAKAIKLENELKEAKAEKLQNQIASGNSSSGSSSNSSYGSSTSGGSSSGNGSSSNNTSTNKHIGRGVYIANGNSYYHAISNCKYLEGAGTSFVTLTASMRKYECNCWTNPIVYKPPTSSGGSSGGSSSSGGRTVYIASGNSYYHVSSSCKFLGGASATAVGINSVGGKHACNCVKY